MMHAVKEYSYHMTLDCSRKQQAADKKEPVRAISPVRSETRNENELSLVPRPHHCRLGGHGIRRPECRARTVSAETCDRARFRSRTGM